MIFEFKVKTKPFCVDGDTIRVMLDLGFDIYKQVDVRVSGVDAPQISKKVQKTAALNVKRIAQKWIDISVSTTVISIEKDKYEGRIVGDIKNQSGELLSQFLVKSQLAKGYAGGERKLWTEEQLIKIASII